MCDAAVKLCKSIKYASAGCIAHNSWWSCSYCDDHLGTIEFLVDDESGQFFFLEMNTRIQVHEVVIDAGEETF
jgi:urea carboxylase